MSPDRLIARWVGVALVLVAVVATLWLGFSGRLDLYINPQYTVFAIVMALIGGVLAVSSFVVLPGREAHDDEDEDAPRRGPLRRILVAAGSVLVVAAAVVALLVAPPSTLSSSAAANRDVTGLGSGTTSGSDAPQLAGGNSASFTVKDWASLIRQGGDAGRLASMPADVTGFVVADGGNGDEKDVYYLARYLITCCAVDATPIGVPVYAPGWQNSLKDGDWVELTGTFRAAPDPSVSEQIVLVPTATKPIAIPDDPYVY